MDVALRTLMWCEVHMRPCIEVCCGGWSDDCCADHLPPQLIWNREHGYILDPTAVEECPLNLERVRVYPTRDN